MYKRQVPTYPITEGKAARIMTGAPVPEGADAIIMHERTSFTENTVTLTAPVTSANIIPPGEDVAAVSYTHLFNTTTGTIPIF